MKKIIVLLIAFVLLISCVACSSGVSQEDYDKLLEKVEELEKESDSTVSDSSSKKSNPTPTYEIPKSETKTDIDNSGGAEKNTNPSSEYNNTDDLKNGMATDVQNTLDLLSSELEKVKESTKNYSTYKTNESKLSSWYDLCLTESEKLYEKLTQDASDYYTKIANTIDISDYDEWDDALDDCYNAWDDALDDYYDGWDELFDDVYDTYDDILNDAYDTVSYKEASSAWSDMYSAYSESWSEMYEKYSDTWSDMYEKYSDTWSSMYEEYCK